MLKRVLSYLFEYIKQWAEIVMLHCVEMQPVFSLILCCRYAADTQNNLLVKRVFSEQSQVVFFSVCIISYIYKKGINVKEFIVEEICNPVAFAGYVYF